MKIINEDASRPLNQELVKFIMQNEFTEEDIKNAVTVVKSSRESWNNLSDDFMENKGPNSCKLYDGHLEMIDVFGPEGKVVVGIVGDINRPSSDAIYVYVNLGETNTFVSEFSYTKGELPKAISLANRLSDEFSSDYDEDNVVEVCTSLGMEEG